jgi:hypothetical protein
MYEKVDLLIGGQTVTIDTGLLAFDEATLSEYLEKEGGYYAYFGAKLAEAEREFQQLELSYDVIFAERFKDYKDQGGSDKYAESRTVCDPDVEKAKRDMQEGKYKVRQLQQYLRAWDRNHECAQNRGNTLRRELDKLNQGIYAQNPNFHALEERVDEIIGRVVDEQLPDK